jgi:multiple sugar transport system permease protein
MLVFVLAFPMVYVIGMAFFKYRPHISIEWVGLNNFISILKNQTFFKALTNTFIFSFGSVIFHVILGMGAALILNIDFRGRVIIRTLCLLPWMLSYVVGSITWRWILNGSYGIFNEILSYIGIIDTYIPWLGDPRFAMGFVIIANIWKQFPFIMLMFVAGLQSVPFELYEAAKIDGAGSLRCFYYITIPSLKQVIIITSTLDFIWSFKQFDLISIMTGGGPGNATEVLSTLIRAMFFNSFDFGMSSAAAVILLVIVAFISVLYAKLIFSEKRSQTDRI